ncbi:post-GPI attachment to proteins factor 6 isoform X2 [Cydia strobilella]|uniref:post-GPI attachment to proteins factor 6 isoform X1 n=1 Tax=Cydia strobilella TaxID=1100964 RepID=UPI003005796A
MKISLYFFLFYVCNTACNGDKEAEEEASRKRILDQLTKTRTVILDDYHLVTRQIATDVYMYRSYRTVSVVFYPVRKDVSDARFTFQAEELHLNNIGRCDPQDVIINIKHGSYPAVNPDGYPFPKDFVDPATRDNIHTVELLSDGKNKSYSITHPKPGSWYALVYRKWEDPRTQKVEQQGLVADCHTILYTDLQVKIDDDIRLIDCDQGITISYSNIPATYKCMVVDNIQPVNFNFTITNTASADRDVIFLVQALYQPTLDNNLLSCYFDPRASNVHSVNFIPHPNAWHYFRIEHYTPDNDTKINDCNNLYYARTEEDDLSNHSVIDLMRDDKGRFFTFDYGLPTTDLQDATSLVNLTSDEVKSLRFPVTKILDIGGTLALEASLLMKNLKYYMGWKRDRKGVQGNLLAFTEDSQYMRVVICLDIGHTSLPLSSGHCQYNDHVKPALFVLNSTDSESIDDKVIIPFPDDGQWYLTFRLFCDEVVCPCRTFDNGTKYYVNSSVLDRDEEDLGNVSMREGEKDCNVTVVLSISSSSCVGGRCGNHGSCLLNTFGGLIMSFCSCTAGYGGWDCTDDSRMDSSVSMIVSVLLLTLSNMLFFISIYVAIIRLYYTEAMMYGFTMVFSTFYHACDAPAQVAYCITRPNILQFGDFYCGIMCFWVTLLAMAIMGDKLRSSLQLIGAIIIALLTTWNMHSIVAFILPVAIGCGFLLLSWYLDWRKAHALMFNRSYYTTFLPIGIFLVGVGLICFAFLQTEQNYKIVHSIWHMIIAASVVFLLPDIKRGDDVNPFLPGPNFWRLPFCSKFNRSQTPNTVNRSQTPTTTAPLTAD